MTRNNGRFSIQTIAINSAPMCVCNAFKLNRVVQNLGLSAQKLKCSLILARHAAKLIAYLQQSTVCEMRAFWNDVICIYKRLVSVCLCVCLSVCVSGVGVQTSGPIATKLGMSVEGHLAGDLGGV